MTILWRIDPLERLLVAMPAQKKTPHIQEHSGSLLYSQEPTFSPCPDSNPIHTLPHYIFKICLPINLPLLC